MLNISSWPALLAAITPSDADPKTVLPRGAKEGLIVVGAILVLTTLLLLWAMAIRKPRRRHGSRQVPEEPAVLVRYRQPPNEDQGLLTLLKPRHKRRKRRFRHRNPTLAETGGLPPVRSDEAAPPAAKP